LGGYFETSQSIKTYNNDKLHAWIVHDENLIQQHMHRELQLITKRIREENALIHTYQHLNWFILLCSGENYKGVIYTLNLCIVTNRKG
jgi:hypothetical protein